MERTKVNLLGTWLDNPVIPASGTFGYGREFAELYDINILGTFSFKGTTLHPRLGNPLPRIAEAPAGMLNAVGLQNPGVDRVISEELPNLAKIFHKPVMANVSGFSIEEYAETCRRLDACAEVGWLEVNISCPNVHHGGMSFGTDPAQAAAVTKAVKAVTTKPVIMKLSPNVTDIVAIAKACADAGLRYIEWGSDVHVPAGNEARAREVRALCASAGIDPGAYGSYFRLGQGGGYYDRFLPKACGYRLGVCHEWELLPAVPREAHDERVNGVLTGAAGIPENIV